MTYFSNGTADSHWFKIVGVETLKKIKILNCGNLNVKYEKPNYGIMTHIPKQNQTI